MTSKTITKIFLDSLCRGTGKARILIEQDSYVGKNDIYKACIHNYEYDPQCGGDRAYYMYEIIKKSVYKDELIEKILNGFAEIEGVNFARDVVQRYRLLSIFYRYGIQKAKDLMYKKYTICLKKRFDNLLSDCLISIDGIQAMLFVAEQNGKKLMKNKDDRYDDYIIEYAQKKSPQADLRKILDDAGKKNKYIKAYYDAVKHNQNEITENIKNRKESYSYDSLINLINQGVWIGLRKKYIHPHTLLKIAHLAVKEVDDKKKGLYLFLFKSRVFPLGHKILFDIIRNSSDRLHRIAIDVLSQFSNKEVRKFAIDNLTKTINGNKFDYLSLLEKNYKAGDSKLITSVLKQAKDHNDYHHAGSDVLSIYENTRTKECLEPLLDMYDKTRCGGCRFKVVKILIENGILPKEIRDEIQYDSNDDIRGLASHYTH